MRKASRQFSPNRGRPVKAPGLARDGWVFYVVFCALRPSDGFKSFLLTTHWWLANIILEPWETVNGSMVIIRSPVCMFWLKWLIYHTHKADRKTDAQTDTCMYMPSHLPVFPSVMTQNDWCDSQMVSCCLQVESPLAVEAMLGETLFSVTDEKVSILELRVHAISGLALSIQPSPGNSHTMVAKATGLQTLTAPKQVLY